MEIIKSAIFPHIYEQVKIKTVKARKIQCGYKIVGE